jgi:ABC-type polysaccharide/polyol phosphate transport system ATPase subunit
MTFLTLRDVHVRYPVFHTNRSMSLFSQMAKAATFGALTGSGDRHDIYHVHALRGVTLDLQEGDRVGLIGRNGAGKSTLLKTAAGINWPHEGAREALGRISCMLNLHAGLDLDRSGYENIAFLGRLFGLSQADRAALKAEMEDFTQLGSYLDLPTRTYSAGMMLRLAFGLATALPGDILLIDEAIGAGDAFFMERAAERARAVSQKAKLILMASHSEDTLSEFCTHVVWLEQGRIVDYGPIRPVWARYAAETPRFPEGIAVTSQMLRDSTVDEAVMPAAAAAAE